MTDVDSPDYSVLTQPNEDCPFGLSQSARTLGTREEGQDVSSVRGEGLGRGRFQLVPASSLEVKSPDWLIQGLLEVNSLAMLFGDPKSGKSFLAMDWACRIATGTAFHSRRVKQAPVVYIAGEGHNGVARRLNAWEVHNQVTLEGQPLAVSTAAASLCDSAGAQEVVTEVDKIAERHGNSPGLLVIDTVARNLGPGDENSNADMSQLVDVADDIRRRHQAAVLFVHHMGHANKTRGRGGSALSAALDSEYRVDKDRDGIVRMEIMNMKEAAEADPMAFMMTPVALAVKDDEGKRVTSAVLQPVAYRKRSSQGRGAQGKRQKAALQALDRITAEVRRDADEDDADAGAVSIQRWKERMSMDGIPRQRISELVQSLEKNGEIDINGDFVTRA